MLGLVVYVFFIFFALLFVIIYIHQHVADKQTSKQTEIRILIYKSNRKEKDNLTDLSSELQSVFHVVRVFLLLSLLLLSKDEYIRWLYLKHGDL